MTLQTHTDPNKRCSLAEVKNLAGGVSHTFIYQQVKKGLLAPPEKLGRMSRWKYTDVMAWLNGETAQAH